MQIYPRFSLGGTYWALMIAGYMLTLATAVALGQYSRNVTIADRLVLLAAVGWITVRLVRQNRIWTWPLLLAGFFVAYSARVLVESQGNRLGKPAEEYLLYLWGLAFVPSLGAYLLGCRGNAGRFDVFFFLLLSTCFSFVAWNSWGFYFQASLSVRVRGMSAGEQTISPLALSYMGTAALLVGAWAAARVPGWRWKLCASFAGLSGLVPIYLGSSRGPLVAMVFAGMAYVARSVLVSKSRGRALFSGAVVLLFLISIIVLMSHTGSGAVSRLSSMQDDYESGSSSMARLNLYEFALQAFLEAPLLGSALEVRPGTYPHNIILEALMSCGLVGVLYIWVIMSGALRAFRDLDDPLVGWLAVLLFMYLTGSMFSGAIWSAGIMTCLVMYFNGRSVYAASGGGTSGAGQRPSLEQGRGITRRLSLPPVATPATSPAQT